MIRIRSLLGLLTKGPRRRAGLSKRPQPFRPALEALEARYAPSSLSLTHGQHNDCVYTNPFGYVGAKNGPDGGLFPC